MTHDGVCTKTEIHSAPRTRPETIVWFKVPTLVREEASLHETPIDAEKVDPEPDEHEKTEHHAAVREH